MDIPSYVPNYFFLGDTWQWTRDLTPDYPAGTWTLVYRFVKQSTPAQAFTVTATDDGSTHTVTIPAATTANYTEGDYLWAARVSSGLESYTVETGTVELRVNPFGSIAFDMRTHARRTLDALESLIEGRATKAELEMTAFGRTLKYMPLGDLIKARAHYKQLVDAEQNAEGIKLGLPDQQNIYVRFI